MKSEVVVVVLGVSGGWIGFGAGFAAATALWLKLRGVLAGQACKLARCLIELAATAYRRYGRKRPHNR